VAAKLVASLWQHEGMMILVDVGHVIGCFFTYRSLSKGFFLNFVGNREGDISNNCHAILYFCSIAYFYTWKCASTYFWKMSMLLLSASFKQHFAV